MSLSYAGSRSKRALLVLGSLLALLGVSLMPGSHPALAAPHLRATLSFYSYPVQPPGELRAAFSASQDNEVYMRLTVTPLNGAHHAQFTILAPDQSVYQVLDVPFPARRPGTPTVWGELPIAGTWMTRLPGTWRVLARLDSNPTILAQAQFELTW
jgi:hypothetical protein